MVVQLRWREGKGRTGKNLDEEIAGKVSVATPHVGAAPARVCCFLGKLEWHGQEGAAIKEMPQ
jgi:hypothetical protein